MLYQIHPQLLAHGISYREFLRVPVVGTSYGVILVAIHFMGRIVFRRRINFPTEIFLARALGNFNLDVIPQSSQYYSHGAS